MAPLESNSFASAFWIETHKPMNWMPEGGRRPSISSGPNYYSIYQKKSQQNWHLGPLWRNATMKERTLFLNELISNHQFQADPQNWQHSKP
jgi:hypothetical protein